LEGKLKELEKCRRWPVIVIAGSCNPKAIPIDMHSLFLHEVKMEAPDFHERGFMLVALSSRVPLHQDVSLTELAHHTAGMVLGDLFALYSHATRIAYHRIVRECAPSLSYSQELDISLEEALSEAGGTLRMCDFEAALSILQAAHSDAIGAPKVPNVSWDDVGGLADAKREILETIQLPLNHPEWFGKGLTRSGVLLYGPPGCGKTLLAKAVANECSLNFLSVKGPELLNMYVGQSEQNVREVFTRARDARPCVVFFDELDSLAPNRGRSGDSGGVMDRVVSQLLTELDGIDKVQDVFVIGATNRPDLVDPALLRPGRFDRLVYLGVPDTHTAQLSILTALTRKFILEDKFDLSRFVDLLGMTLTGADLYALCSDAMLNAMKKNIEEYEAGTKRIEDNELLLITESDFRAALENLQPSVTEEDLKQYQEIRHRMTTSRH
jgi:peroxin-6